MPFYAIGGVLLTYFCQHTLAAVSSWTSVHGKYLAYTKQQERDLQITFTDESVRKAEAAGPLVRASTMACALYLYFTTSSQTKRLDLKYVPHHLRFFFFFFFFLKDWVSKGAVTHPTSQGRCATCQDYSAAADIEGAYATAGNPLTKLSEQEMIDCGGGQASTCTEYRYILP